MSDEASRPLCADSCAQYAESEAYLAADTDLCPSSFDGRQDQIRADFVNCALPAKSLSSRGINSTDTCCYNSDITARCAGVVLPAITTTMTFSTPTASATASSSATPGAVSSGNGGLSGGAIAGIVIGSVVGLALLLFLLFMCIRLARRRRGGSQKGSIFNQPSPSRKGLQTAQIPANTTIPQGFEVLPGGRIARMSALEGHSGEPPSRQGGSRRGDSAGAAAAAGAAAGFVAGRKRGGDNHSSSDSFDSPGSETRAGVLRPPPMNIRRNGSLSSSSVLAGEDPQSPTSAGGMSSPPGVNSQQSEQLPFFKDYYSQDDIHPGERVAVLWAYQPRAADEFALERGDMLKVVGIWDDGWATGVMLDERADEWEVRRQAQRDSGVSNTSGRGRDTSPPVSGEIKAFPLVCVCLPEHWRKTIEGDGSTETGSSAHHSGGLPT
ncbi:Exopolyphosphatase [Hypoxylon texense]